MHCADRVQWRTWLIGSYPGGNKNCLIPVADKVIEHSSSAYETQSPTPGSTSASSTVHTAVTVLFQRAADGGGRARGVTGWARQEGK